MVTDAGIVGRRRTLRFAVIRLIAVPIGGVLLHAPVQAAEWSEIARRGHLVVAVKDNLRPLGFRDQQGQLQGFEIDLARQLAQKLLGDPKAVVLQPVLNQERLEQVTSGEVDVAIANLTATDNRRRIVNFSVPYYTSYTSLITKHSEIKTASDLKTVAVLQRSHNIAILRSAFPTVQLVGVRSYQQARTALTEKNVDAFAGDHAVLTGWRQQQPGYRVVGQPLARRPLAVALPKGLQYDSLLARINTALTQLRQSGWLQQRQQHWGLDPG